MRHSNEIVNFDDDHQGRLVAVFLAQFRKPNRRFRKQKVQNLEIQKPALAGVE